MNWEAIGALGELVNALVVLITLIYLAVQVRHGRGLLEESRKAAMSEVHQARASSRIAEERAMMQSEELSALVALLWQEDFDPMKLSESQVNRLRHYAQSQLIHWDNLLYQWELGLLDDYMIEGISLVIPIAVPRFESLGLRIHRRVLEFYSAELDGRKPDEIRQT